MQTNVRSRRRNFVARRPSLSPLTAVAMLVLAAGSQLSVPLVESFLIAPTSPSFLSRSVLIDHPFQCCSVSTAPLQRQRPILLSSSSVQANGFVKAEDLEGLQALFSKYCDKEGLMTKEVALQIPAISELMEEGDLQVEEFDDIWNKAPKFPAAEDPNERIDVDSFVQIYQDIDDLFEDDDDDDLEEEKTTTPNPTSDTENETEGNFGVEVNAENITSEEDELEAIFHSICDKDGFLSKQQLTKWDEVKNLLDEGLLGKNELDALWEKVPKKDNKMQMTGFLSFNRELDGLFDFEEEEGEFVEGIEEEDLDDVDQSELSPEELFSVIAGPDGLVGKNDLSRWSELQEMISDGELTRSELDELYIKSSMGDTKKLDQAAFVSLYKAIDDLFEEFDINKEDEPQQEKKMVGPAQTPNQQASEVKTTLLRALEILNSDEERLQCGLEATPDEQKRIRNIVEVLESQPTNIIRIKKGAIAMEDLAGSWELLYSSSSAMKFNKGLSGLGGSFPNGRFGGLEQKLVANKFMTDVEYTEHIDVKPSSASFDVKVTGGWELRQSVSLFTGEPSTVLTVEPERVTYGPTSTRADHWKSLGPMNMLDVTYLDHSLRIMRGNTSVETIFIFRRVC